MSDINTMLIYGIVVGCFFILLAMILNIVNGIKNKDFKRVWLDSNGVAGFVLYGFSLFLIAWYFLKGEMLISTSAIVVIVCVLLILILFNSQLTKIVTRKREEAKVQMIEKIFELLEMILSFASNTISFLRLAAFAINHVRFVYGNLFISRYDKWCWKYFNCDFRKHNCTSIRRFNCWNTNFEIRVL